MKLLGIPFPPILNGPGARGFFGEGYPFHRFWHCLGMTHDGIGFAAKTFSLDAYAGNLPLGPDRLTPRELLPRCIYVDFWRGHILNAVKLSNPGCRYLLNQDYWQTMKDPFFLSFAAISEKKADRLEETREFVRILLTHLPFRSRFALQLDTSCPNLGYMIETEELNEALEILGELQWKYDLPLVPNFSASASAAQMIKVAKNPFVSALWIANSIPWGFPGIDWKGIFGSDISPLAKRGFSNGSYSGSAALPHTLIRVENVRQAGIEKPIIFGNGIRTPDDIKRGFRAGADAAAIASIGLVRPWCMRAIIRAAYNTRTWRNL